MSRYALMESSRNGLASALASVTSSDVAPASGKERALSLHKTSASSKGRDMCNGVESPIKRPKLSRGCVFNSPQRSSKRKRGGKQYLGKGDAEKLLSAALGAL